ncbi:MAG: hypothetical protein ACE5EG_00170 [Thermoanaerobaculia bacterium]
MGRKRYRALGWAVVALLLSLGLARLHDYRGWDQSYYLAVTSSLAEDGDVDLRDDLLHVQRESATLLRALTNLEPNGALANTFAIGTSILWLPPYALAMPLGALTTTPAGRWSRPQLGALHLFTLALMVWLLWAFDRWFRRMGIDHRLAALGALALVLGTPLVIYGFRAYMGSHQTSAVAVMLLVLATLRLADRGSPGSAWLWGIALGLVFLCRWQDLVKGAILLVPILELRKRGLKPARWVQLAVAAGAAVLLVAGVQLHAWLLERGEIFALPQGRSYIDLTDPEVGRFLFSGLSGLIPWSPLFVVGLIGLLAPWRCRLPATWRWVALTVLFFDVFLNATVDDWWGGAAYGARRMTSDVPLLAIGLGNLASWRRLRWPLAAALVACCLWGAVTANLRVHGLRDLAILVSGGPSVAPGAEREGGAQPSHAEALEVATSWPLRLGRMSYFAGSWRPGRSLTVILGAVVCLLVGWLLGRARAADRFGAALLAVLALVLCAHVRLLFADRVGPAERGQWVELSLAAKGRLEAAAVPGPAADRDGRWSDARSFLRAAALRRQGRNEEASALIAELGSYPFKPHLLEALSMAEGERLLIARRGFFHQTRRRRPFRELILARPVELECEALQLTVRIELPVARSGIRGPLVSVGRRSEEPLAMVEIASEGGLGLRTAEAFEEVPLAWHPEGPHRLQLDWAPRAGLAKLEAIGPEGQVVELSASAGVADGSAGRFQVVIGSPAEAAPGLEPPWGARFSDLRLTARDVCTE